MADEKYKIKIEVDDSAEKQYEAEFKSRLKVKTATAIEEEKRKTAQLKGEVEKSVQSQLEAERQGNKMKIKEAIAYRKIMESQLRLYEQEVRLSNAKDLSEFRSLLKEKERLQKQADRDIKNAPRTMLRGETGSLSRLGQVNNALSGMTFGTDQYKATEQLSKNLTANLNKVGVDTRNLAQKIGGELKGALDSVQGSMLNYLSGIIAIKTAQEIWNLSLDTKKFEVLKSNFQGTEQDLENLRIASARTVDDASLIKLSNQAQDLGIGLKDQTILFSLAEDASDKYGITVEEAFQKVVFATEGNTKGLKMLGIQKAQYEQTLRGLVKSAGAEIEMINGENGEREISIKNLGAEEQKRLRLQAVLMSSNTTYDDAINKQQDEADVQESGLVTLKNLTLEYGFLVVKGLIPFIGALDKLPSAIKKQIENFKQLQTTVTNALGDINDLTFGLLGLRKEAEDPFVLNFQTVGLEQLKADVDNAVDIIQKKFRDAGLTLDRSGGDASLNVDQKSTAVTKSKNSGSKGSKTETQKETLNLIELENEKLAKLNEQLQANLGDYGSELQIRRQILEVELEIFRLRTGQKIDLGKSLSGLNSIGLTSAEVRQRVIGKNLRAGNDPRGDMSSEEIDKLLNGVQLSFEDIKGIADSIVQPFQNILQFAGLTETSFGRILAMIQTVLNAGSDVFSFFTSILSFIPGGGVISAIGGLAGGASQGLKPMGGGHSGGMSFNPTVIVNSEVEKTKSIKFYQNTLPEFNRRQASKSL